MRVLCRSVTVTLSGTATISAGGNGTNSLTLSGSQVDINTTLASLSYQGTLNYNGPDTLTVTSRDSNAVTDADTHTITLQALDYAAGNPLLEAKEVNEDTALAVGGISFTEVEENLRPANL